MATILHIDTALETATVAISVDNNILISKTNNTPITHAVFVQQAIKDITTALNMSLAQLDGVSVVNGPGSYTGLRVGLASAKGICYALKKPLLLLHTLELMALEASKQCDNYNLPVLFAPMIDARRMDVFTGLYNLHLEVVAAPQALTITPELWHNFLENHYLVFSGGGSNKAKEIIVHKHAVFINTVYTLQNVIDASFLYFNKKKFANLAYAEPFYEKEVFVTTPKKLL